MGKERRDHEGENGGEEEEEEKDQVIAAIGEFGPWQRRYILLLAFTTLFSAVPSLIIKFMAAPTDFWCAGSGQETLWGSPLHVQTRPNHSSPLVLRAGVSVPDPCSVWNSTDFSRPPDNSTLKCDRWQYNTTVWRRTIITQYNLVCDRAHFKNDAQSVFFAGMMVGVFTIGFFSDRFGRKAVLVPSVFIMLLVGSILPFMPNVQAFMVFRFFHGLFKMGVFTVAFVWCMEAVGGKWKTYIGVGIEFPWVASWLILSLMAYLVPDWQYLTWMTTLPGYVCLALFWLLPESPKWLLTAGKLAKAEETIRKAASANKRSLPEGWNLHEVEEKEHVHKGNIIDLFKSKNMAAKTLILYGNWFTNSFVYYGLTLNTGDLGGSFMLTFVLYGVLEIPAYAFALFVILKAGRKLPYVTLMALTGVALLAILAVPEDRFTGNWPVVILAMLGKFFITATFAIIYVFSAETYPTVVRSVGIGSSSVFARIGGMVAPYVGSLDVVIDPTFPIAIFGVTALFAAVLALWLPETKTRKLPDTMQEGEAVGVSVKDGVVTMKKTKM